jgi:hypothetical protein
MPWVLNETIHYSVSGCADALDKIRQFAVAQGWTQDYWTGGNFLQIYSPGYVNQEICYRFAQGNYDVNNDYLRWMGVRPGYRFDTDYWNTSKTWGASNTTYDRFSLPTGAFTALYLYGNDRFISAIFHIDPIAVITLHLGTIELLPEWWYYPGLWFYRSLGVYSMPNSGWSVIASNPAQWYTFLEVQPSTRSYSVWWEGERKASNEYTINFIADNQDDPQNNPQGDFNRVTYILRYNAFTDKRVAFSPTHFVQDTGLGVWYPIGQSPHIMINGRDLTIGEQIIFGADTYRCFPMMYSTTDIWQAYRTA